MWQRPQPSIRFEGLGPNRSATSLFRYGRPGHPDLGCRAFSSKPPVDPSNITDTPGSSPRIFIACMPAATTLKFGRGASNFSLGFISVVECNPYERSSPMVWVFLVIGGAALVFFLCRKQQVPKPVLDLSPVSTRAFSVAIAVGIILPGLCSSATLLLLYYFRVILKAVPALASLQMVPWTLTTALLGFLIGHRAARLKAETMLSGGLLVMGIEAAGWLFARPQTRFVRVAVPPDAGRSVEPRNHDLQDVGRHQCRIFNSLRSSLGHQYSVRHGQGCVDAWQLSRPDTSFALAGRDCFRQMSAAVMTPGNRFRRSRQSGEWP